MRTPKAVLRRLLACDRWIVAAHRKTWLELYDYARSLPPGWSHHTGEEHGGLIWSWLAAKLKPPDSEDNFSGVSDANTALGCLPLEAWLEAIQAYTERGE
jgi:hypothetical protein